MYQHTGTNLHLLITVICLYEVEKDLSIKVSLIKNWRHKHTIANFQIKRCNTNPLKMSLKI